MRHPLFGWLQVLVMLFLTIQPLSVLRAVYVPDGGGAPYWLPLNANDPEVTGGANYNDDGSGFPVWWTEFQSALNSGTIGWWGGGSYYVDGNQVSLPGQYYSPGEGDSDGDGIPNRADPYPGDANNNTFYWQGGDFTVNNSTYSYSGGYYQGGGGDSDSDGIPDVLDPYPVDSSNGNATTFYWAGGTFTIADGPYYFSPQDYSGAWSDSDGDGIPDAADPYPSDSNNGNSYTSTQYWPGGDYYIDGGLVSFYSGDYSIAENDGDGIPDSADPYPNEFDNNTSWWGGGTFLIDGNSVTASGQYHRASAGDSDTDGLPDDLDPYPSDITNNTFWWSGGTFWINGAETTYYPQHYAGTATDDDEDGIPDSLDPYAQNTGNNTSWWPGGGFLINGEYSTFVGQYYAGLPTDVDLDGIPDALDPYANDPWNNTYFYWTGGSYLIDGKTVAFPQANYGGLWNDVDEDGIPGVADPYPEDVNNNTSWWSGGVWLVNAVFTTIDGQWCRANAGDTDSDGIPNGIDPHPNDFSNNTFAWAGGTFWINDSTIVFGAQYYAGGITDTDSDGIPDSVDPHPTDANNGNTTDSFWWVGGTFTIDNQSVFFGPKFYPGTMSDSDSDDIPDAADPYPLNPFNTTNGSFYWGGGIYTISNSEITFTAKWYSGTWSDSDGDGIPNVEDPFPNSSGNNNTFQLWWDGVQGVVINGLLTSIGGQHYTSLSATIADSDGDLIPNELDPYSNDSSNNSAWWSGLAVPGGLTYPEGWHPANDGDTDGDSIPNSFDSAPNDPLNGLYFAWPSFEEGVGVTYTINNQVYTFWPNYYGGSFVDSDGDGIPNQADPSPADATNNADTDGDHIPDRVELQYGQYGLHPNDASDAVIVRVDGLTNLQAYQSGLPLNAASMDSLLDTDGDGMKDVYEVINSLDRFDARDVVGAPAGDLVFNFEKAAHGRKVSVAVVSPSDYLFLTGHLPDDLLSEPTTSVAENDWDNDGVSNIDEVLVFLTDPRDSTSWPANDLIRIALIEGKASLTTRINFLWTIDPSGGGIAGGTPQSVPPGAGSPPEVDILDPVPPPDSPSDPPPEPPQPPGEPGDPGEPPPQGCLCGGWTCACIEPYACAGATAQCYPPLCLCGCGQYGCYCGQSAPSVCGCGCSLQCCTCGGSGSCTTTTQPPETPPTPEGAQDLTLPVDEASGARYRKIALNGRPMADEKPQHSPETDQAKEETFIDAMTLGLRHSVTDIFVPIPGSDLTLSARRNLASTVWNLRSGLRPHERRDRPFGAGWTSSLAPTVEFVATPGQPLTVYVTDENGTSHRFAHWQVGEANHYVPWPTSNAENSDHLTSFEGGITGGIYTTRYGTKITFEPSGKFYQLPTDRLSGSSSSETHLFLRATSIRDRLEKTVNFTYSGSGTLIPDAIGVAGKPSQTIQVRHNSQGLVTGIWDPKGWKTEFTYGTVTYQYKGVQHKAPVLLLVRGADGAATRYTYDVALEPDLLPGQGPGDETPKFHLDLESIRGPHGHTYSFAYQFDHSRWDYKRGGSFTGYFQQTGLPRNVSLVTLPDGNQASFDNQSTLALRYVGATAFLTPSAPTPGMPSSLRQTEVTDAEGHKTTYTWGGAQVLAMKSLTALYTAPIKVPKIVYFTQMSVNYSGLGTQVYTFDLNAGMAVSSVQDLCGNTTQFAYGDAWNAPAPFQTLFGGMIGQYPDPTVQTNALGQEKQFRYVGPWRIMDRVIDEAGRVTVNEVDEWGRRTKETIKNASDEVEQVTDFLYENTGFRGVVTKRVVENFNGHPWARNLVTQFVLDENGRVTDEIVDPGGLHLVTHSTYDTNGNKLSTTDPRGHTTTFSYDPRNRLVEVTYPNLTTKKITYDLRGNKRSETDENGHVTRFEYDEMNRLEEQRRVVPGGDLVSYFEYNKVGSRLWASDPNGHTTYTYYDALQRPTSIKDALGKETKFTYDGNSGANAFDSSGFKPTSVEDANGYVTTTVNDELYRTREVHVTYAEGATAVTRTSYDAVGNPTYETDPLNRVTVKTYDALNRLTSITFPDLTTNSFAYTPTGLKWKSVDELGRETNTEYDGAGRAVKVFAPVLAGGSRATTETIYDGAGNIAAIINPLDQRTDLTYDTRNRKVSETGPAVPDAVSGESVRPVTENFYDGVGNVIGVKDPRQYVTWMEYDAANRKVRVLAPNIPVGFGAGGAIPITRFQYDGVGNVLSTIDPKGRETVNTYDPVNRLLTTTDGAGITVSNEYDDVGNRTTVIDGKGQRTEFTYDGLKRNLTTTNALNKTTTFTYDALNKTGRTDANGNVTSYGYDERHRLLTVEYTGQAAENRTYAYDDAGRLLSVTEPGGKADVAYTYDALNRVTTETSGGLTHQYTYDLAGNRLTTVYGDTSRTLVSTYDALNRLETVTESPAQSGGRVTEYQYDLVGNVVAKILPNDDTVGTVYDALNRAWKITGRAAGGALLYEYTQARDVMGNVVGITEETANLPMRTVGLIYDDADRLLSEYEVVGGQAKTTAFTYDLANNRETRTKLDINGASTATYTYSAGNQLTGWSEGARSVTFTYDDNGSRTTRSENGILAASYGYDRENRLISLTQDGHTYAYTYDYRTRRVERVEDGAETKVVFSGGTSVQEYTQPSTNPQLAVEYVRGSDWGGGVGGILYTLRSGAPSFTHYDSRGDVTAKTDGTGAVTYQAAYEAFGTRTQEQGATDDRQKANTKEEDPTGLLNEGMRYRDLETGTFISADPAGFVDGPNLYAYVRQNPWTMFDPEGLYQQIPAAILHANGIDTTSHDYQAGFKQGMAKGAVAGVGIGAVAITAVYGGPALAAYIMVNPGSAYVAAETVTTAAEISVGYDGPPLIPGPGDAFRAAVQAEKKVAQQVTKTAKGAAEETAEALEKAAQRTLPDPPPNPITAKPGEMQTVDPKRLTSGQRDSLAEHRLKQQEDLIASGTPRKDGPIEVHTNGVLNDGHHGTAAAAKAGKSVTVRVVPGEGVSKTNLPPHKLPTHKEF